MFPVVPCVVAFFAPLHAASAAPVAPTPAMIQQAASFARRPVAPTPAMLTHAAAGVAPTPAGPAAAVAQIVVPDESRTRLGDDRPASVAAPEAPAPESFYATVRKRVRDGSLAPCAAATLLVESAVENERVGHHNLARDDLELALERDPTHAEARRMRGKRRHAAGDDYGALRDAEADLAARPTDPAARYAHACMAMCCGRDAQAHAELTALIQDYPRRPEYYASRAAAAHRLGRDRDAELDSEIAVELAPADPACRLLRMKSCLADGRYEEAYGNYQAGFRDDPMPASGSPELRVLVEFLALAHEHFEPASAHADQTLARLDWMVKACPDFNPPRHLLAVEYLRASRPDLAEQVATDALGCDPTDARAFHLRGLARAALASPDARLDFETALGLDETAEVRAELVTLHRAAGRRAEARDLAEAGVELHPQCGTCRQFLADDDLRRWDFSAAERHATCAAWLARGRAEATAARLTRLLARLARGDLEAAADDYAKLPVNEDVTVPLVTLRSE